MAKRTKTKNGGKIMSKDDNKIIWLDGAGKMTKKDYMRLPKERLAEMLVAKNNGPTVINIPFQSTRLQCYEPGGICTNPFRDCINCPRVFGDQSYTITTSQTILKDEK